MAVPCTLYIVAAYTAYWLYSRYREATGVQPVSNPSPLHDWIMSEEVERESDPLSTYLLLCLPASSVSVLERGNTNTHCFQPHSLYRQCSHCGSVPHTAKHFGVIGSDDGLHQTNPRESLTDKHCWNTIIDSQSGDWLVV